MNSKYNISNQNLNTIGAAVKYIDSCQIGSFTSARRFHL